MRNSCPGRYYADPIGKLKVVPIPVTEQMDTGALKRRLIGFSLRVVGTRGACDCLVPEQEGGGAVYIGRSSSSRAGYGPTYVLVIWAY